MLNTLGRARAALLLAPMAVLAVSGAATAQTAGPLNDLLAGAKAAPRVAEAQAGVRQAEAGAVQASMRPNPVLGVEMENVLGSGPYDGFDRAETTASIEQTLELGGKRTARMTASQAAVKVANARALLAWNDYAAGIIAAYAEAEAGVSKARLFEDLLAAAEADARVAGELVAAGREAELRNFQAAADLEGARAELAEARAGRDVALLKLSALVGAPQPYRALAQSVLDGPEPPQIDYSADSPSITLARAELETADARVAIERSRARPDLTLSAGVRRFNGDDATALVAGFSVPLPVRDRNQGASMAAQAERLAAEAKLRQAEREVSSDLQVAQIRARSIGGRIAAARLAEQAAVEAYRLARIGYEAGRLPLLEVTSARRALANAELQTLAAQLARALAQADIARLTGRNPFGG